MERTGREAAKTHRVSWSGTKNTLRPAGDRCATLNALTHWARSFTYMLKCRACDCCLCKAITKPKSLKKQRTQPLEAIQSK